MIAIPIHIHKRHAAKERSVRLIVINESIGCVLGESFDVGHSVGIRREPWVYTFDL